MAIDICEICSNTADANCLRQGIGDINRENLWRRAVIEILCGISGAVVAPSEPSAFSGAVVPFGSVTTNYTVGLANTEVIKVLDVVNTLNVPIWVSLDGTNDAFYIPAGQARTFPLQQMGILAEGPVYIKSVGAAGSGNVAISIGS